MLGPFTIPAGLRDRPQFVQFLTVGIVGFLIDQAVLIALVELTDLILEVAKVISAEVAIIVMFLVNDRWTYAGWGRTDRWGRLRRLLRSNLVRVGGIVVAVGVLSILVRGFGMPYPVANAIGIGCGFVVNYTFETLYTWRVKR